MDWLKEFKRYEEDFMKDLKGLLAIPSVRDDATACENAPFGKGCRQALDYMLELGRKEGFDVVDIDGYAGVISYGNHKESIGVLAHLDVVPVGEGWTKDPFDATVENGYIFARGVLDDKGPGMAAFYALKMIKDLNIPMNKKIMLIYGCDEETGMECMDYYVKQGHEVPSMGFTPDAEFPVIYGEKGCLHINLQGTCNTVIQSMHAGSRPNVVIGKASLIVKEFQPAYQSLFDFYLQTNQLRGSVCECEEGVELMIEGTAAHAAMPYYGNNAALHLLNFVGNTYGDAFAKQTYALLYDWQGKPLGIEKNGAYMGFLTMNTGIIQIKDGHVDITIDIRYPNDVTSNEVVESMKHAFTACDYPLQLNVTSDTKPLFVDPNSTLVQTLSQVYQAYTNDTFTPNITIGGGTYAKKFPNFVAFGPEFPNRKEEPGIGGCHQKDEAIKVDDLMLSGAIYCAAIERLAK